MFTLAAAVGCSRRIGLLADRAGSRPVLGGRIASCSPAVPHIPAGRTAAEVAGSHLAAAGSYPGHNRPVEGVGCAPAGTAAAAADRSLGYIDRIQT